MRFWEGLETHRDRIAFRDEQGVSISFAQLARAADAFTDLPAGSLVLLSLDNSIASMVAYVGALRRGLPAILINTRDESAAATLKGRYRPRAFWSPASGLKHLHSDESPAVHPDLALLLSTSGSTGSAKLVRLSAQAVSANAESIVEYLGITPEDRAITTLPPAYSYGLSVINVRLTAGATTILYTGSVTDAHFRELVMREQATSVPGVPYTHELLDRSGFYDNLPPSVRTITQAGGRLRPELARRIAERARQSGARLFLMYGQTEATARMAYLAPEDVLRFPDSIGRPIPGGRFELLDPETGAETEERGELVYIGPNIMMGYAESASDLARGPELDRLRTGDLAERLESGVYRLTGRKSRFIKLFGQRIALDEVEALLRDEGIEAIATGDNELLVVGVLDAQKVDVADEVIVEELGLPSAYRSVIAVDAIPRLPSGKADYQQILFAGRAVHSRKSQQDLTDSPTKVRTVFAAALNRAQVGPDDSFEGLAGDSLAYVQASMAIEDAIGHLPERWEQLTIREIEGLAAQRENAVRTSSRWIATDVVLRPLMMALIVAGHVTNGPLRGGALALLILAGLSFARFQSRRLFSPERWAIVSNFFVRFILPYYAIMIVYVAFTENQPGWQSLLLINNIWQDPGILTMGSFWFIQALFHCIVAMVALCSIQAVRHFASTRYWEFGFVVLAASLLLRQVVEALSRAWPFYHTEHSSDGWAYAFALGLIVGHADVQWKRIAAIAVTYACTALVWGYANPNALIGTGAVAAVLLIPRIRLWRPAANIVAFLAQATLFIYLWQGIAINLVKVRLGLDSVLVNLVGAAALGSAAYLGWQALLNLMGRRRFRIRFTRPLFDHRG